jgi:hypothetical protein
MIDFHIQPECGPEGAVDWYSGGALKEPGSSGGDSMEAKPAAGFLLVLRKIKLVTSLVALLLVFPPWIDRFKKGDARHV